MHYSYPTAGANVSSASNGTQNIFGFLIGRLLRRIETGLFQTLVQLFVVLALGMAFNSEAQAGNAVTGQSLFTSKGCTGCHNNPPQTPQLNAANASNATVFNYVINNNFGGALTSGTDYMGQFKSAAIDGVNGAVPLTATERADLTAYLESVATNSAHTDVTVAYQSSATANLSLTHDGASNTGGSIALYSSLSLSAAANGNGTVAAASSLAGTSAMGTTTSEYRATYTHTANNCSSDSFTASASGAGGTSSTRTFNVTVTPPTAPNISTSATTSSPAYNTATAIPITSTGGTISSITVTSGLSHGGSLVTNGTTSFTYTSNAAAYSATDSFTYRANGPCANSATVTVNISISAPPTPSITSTLTASGSTGVAFGGYTITASNLPTSYNATGLPAGLSINTATGVISGTPTSSTSYSASNPINTTITATNSSGTDSKTLAFTILLSAPSITSSLTANGATGTPFAGYTIAATNSPTSFNATGLPPGLSINTSTGAISGTPTLNGSYNVSISATNATSTDTKTLVINISLTAPVITSSLAASGATGVVFGGYTITATNLPTSYNATGLPPGLSINTATGAISGTPTTNGTYNTSISATNATATDTQTLVFTIALSAPSITSTLTSSGATGVVFGGYTITATNFPTSFNATGLPPGLSINTVTGAITGTPTTNGTYNTSITATNATATDSKTLVFTIALSPTAITSTLTASGATGVAFAGYTITATNFATSYTATSLPPGLTFDAPSHSISGTPTLNGTFNTTITAANATNTDSKTLVFTIALSAPAVTSTATASGTTGTAFSYQITASNFPTSYGASGLPTGVNVNTTTGLISGTPTASGTYNATVSATNSTATTSLPVTMTIAISAPTAGPASMTVPVNTATTLNLTPYITGYTGFTVSGVSISVQPTHGAVTVSGTSVTYTPANNYFGADSFSYFAHGNGGTSTSAGLVTVSVTGRPNPTQDAAVTGVINAQIDTARRFTHAQITNFTGRLESLHRTSNRSADVVSIAPNNTRTAAARPVATEPVTNNDRGVQQPNLQQPIATKQSDVTQTQPVANADQPVASVSTDPMGADPQIPNTSAKSNPPAVIGRTSTSPATAIQNSSLNVSQGSGNAGAANRLMGDGVRFGVRDLANQTTQQANPLTVLATALSASNASQTDQSAVIGKTLVAAASAIQNSSLNLASSTGTDDSASTLPGGFNYWIAGGVRFGTRDQTSTSSSLDFTTDGISIGADTRINDQFAVGMGLGFGRDKTTIGTDGTNSKGQSGTVAAYGSYQPIDSIFIDGVLGVGTLRYKTDRYVQAAGSFAHANRSGDHAFTSLTTGYEYRTQGLHLSPYGRLDYSVDRLQQATETGAGVYALTYNSQTIESTAFSLGLRAETAHEMNFGWALPRMRIEFQHDFKGAQDSTVSYADQPGTPYTIKATTANQNSILFGLGSDFVLRNGFRLSLDYQMQRSSMHESSQAMLFKLTKELDGKAPSPLLLATSGFSLRDWKIRGSAGYTFDDNINRSSTADERMSDSSYNAEMSKSWLMPVTDHTRLVIGSVLGGEKFHTYTGLDRLYISSQAEYQYRASGDFGRPIWGIFANITGEAYASTLRDGFRYSSGLSVRKPVTDRINLYSAIAHNERHGRSNVFDTRDNSFKFNVDYAATENSTIYLNTEYRRGDLISAGSHTLQNIDIAKVFTRDDVFTKNDFYDYRFDGSTALLTLGYNLPFGPKDSVDFSWQRVRSAASKSPSVAGWPSKHYYDNQLSVVYLFSF